METIDILRHAWFVLIGVLFVGYSILDGFDLGIGALFPFLARDESDKRALVNSIWPVWDGNEVWLLTAGGAMFAVFPQAYATVFSGFYLALMLVLFALIFRAVSLEFWYYDEARRTLWQWAFTIGSLLPALLFGVALGNVVIGVPLDAAMEYAGDFFTLLRPYPLLIGLLGLSAILLQGATYAVLKTDGALRERARAASRATWIGFIGMFNAALIATIVYQPLFFRKTLALVFVFAVVAAWLALAVAQRRRRDGWAFLFSSLVFAGLWGVAGASHHPFLVKGGGDALTSITIANGSSSELTLTVTLVIALIGMPVVIGYTAYVYRVFRGTARV